MGTMVREDARVARIDEVIVLTSVRAEARGGEAAAVTAARLGPFLPAIAGARDGAESARRALVAAAAARQAAHLAAFVVVGTVFDEMRNALGRPARHPAIAAVFPGGLGAYTDAPRAARAALLPLLAGRLTATDAPPWPTGVRAGWAARLDTAGATLAAADAAATAATDAHGAARGAYAQVVRSAWRALVLLKRELKYAGLTEVQVHEIIPDASRRAAAAASTAPDVTVATDLLEGGSTAPAGELPAQAETVPAMVSAREVDPAPDDAGPTEPVRDAADPLAERKASP